MVLGLTGSSVIKSTADFMNVTTLSHMDLMASGAWPSTPARQSIGRGCERREGETSQCTERRGATGYAPLDGCGRDVKTSTAFLPVSIWLFGCCLVTSGEHCFNCRCSSSTLLGLMVGSREARLAGWEGTSEAKSKLLLMSAISECAFSLSKRSSPSANGNGLFERGQLDNTIIPSNGVSLW